jgi:hypothetical protein
VPLSLVTTRGIDEVWDGVIASLGRGERHAAPAANQAPSSEAARVAITALSPSD